VATPLHHSALKGDEDVVVFLVEEGGADVAEEKYKTVLHRAVASHHDGLVRRFIDAGVDVSAEEFLQLTRPIPTTDFWGRNYEWRPDALVNNGNLFHDDFPVTPLYFAILNNDILIAKLLLDHGARVSPTAYNSKLVLAKHVHESARSPRCAKRFGPLLQVLKEAQPDILDGLPLPSDPNVLHWAVANGHSHVVNAIRNSQPEHPSVARDVIRPDIEGNIPIIMAAKNGHTSMIEVFLTHRDSPSVLDSDNRSALFWASRNGHTEIVRMLLDAGAGFSQMDEYGETPLSAAVEYGHIAAAKLLLQAGAGEAISVRDTVSGQCFALEKLMSHNIPFYI
jgi:ankyrin repeat protein